MKKDKYGFPIFENKDLSDLNMYSEKISSAMSSQIDKFERPLRYIDEVQTFEELQFINAENGDVYGVTSENINYAWNGTKWVFYSEKADIDSIELCKTLKDTNITTETIERIRKNKKNMGKNKRNRRRRKESV